MCFWIDSVESSLRTFPHYFHCEKYSQLLVTAKKKNYSFKIFSLLPNRLYFTVQVVEAVIERMV